jgi:hypothetical protein
MLTWKFSFLLLLLFIYLFKLTMNYLTGLAHKAREFVTEVGDVGF